MSRRRPLTAVLATCLLAATCAADEIARLPLGPPERAYRLATGGPGDFVDARTGESAGFDALVADLASADVVVLGESHVSAAGHALQARLLEAIAATGRPFALGMEFFESADDAALARHVAGRDDVADMLVATGWYSGGAFPYPMYQPLVDAARAARAGVFGLNVPRAVVRKVSREGIDALTADERARVGALAEPDPRHRFLVDLMMGGLGASMPAAFDGMFAGQRAWDAAMASAILARRAAPGGREALVVAVVGAGHASHGFGVPERLRALEPGIDVRVVGTVEAERPDPRAAVHPGFEAHETATFSLGLADWIAVLPDEAGAEAAPRWGLGLEEGTRGAARIARVEPGSLAERSGLRAGDELLALDGEPWGSLDLARVALGSARWGTRAVLRVRRAGVETDVPALVVPGTDGSSGEGRWLEGRPASAVLDGFDPASSRSYRQADPAPGTPHARLALAHDEPVRLDLHDGVRHAQAWDLDAHGRPVRGLLAVPAPDGAVRVEIERDAEGSVVAQRRYDAAGSLIAPAEAGPQP